MVVFIGVVGGDAAEGVFIAEDFVEAVAPWDVLEVDLVLASSVVIDLPVTKKRIEFLDASLTVWLESTRAHISKTDPCHSFRLFLGHDAELNRELCGFFLLESECSFRG
jgi:hypothetical protein